MSISGNDAPADEYEYDWIEEEREVVEEAPVTDGGAFQAVPSDDIDEEIREVFLEEVQEEVENLNRNLPDWKNNTADFEKLKPVRRSFHTMKGSGRLVGAMALGEFSWKVENTLNRVLDKTIAISPAVIDLLEKAVRRCRPCWRPCAANSCGASTCRRSWKSPTSWPPPSFWFYK